MPLREDLLNPIEGDNPAGVSLRYDPIYDKIKESRRQEDELEQGDWQRERKVADFSLVRNLTEEAIATKSKDLQLAAWLTEAMLDAEGFEGLRQGLDLLRGMIQQFWEGLHPEVEDEEDMEVRAAPLEWLDITLDMPVRTVPLAKAGFGWTKYKESRTVGYEEQVTSEAQRAARTTMLEEGKLPPEEFDQSFDATPKAFYVQAEQDLDACQEALKALESTCNDKYGRAAPSFHNLKKALEEVRHTNHLLLVKKRELEPDPVATAEGGVADGEAAVAGGIGAGAGLGAGGMIPIYSTEPPERRKAVASIAASAAQLRKQNPYNPGPYLLLRGLRWGELRAAVEDCDPSLLEAPPTELRQHVKSLALKGQWEELLEVAEGAMALPCSRGWLDLQRYVIEACEALGSSYHPIARAIQSELRTLLQDVPQLLSATLMDDTPAANKETLLWLRGLLETATAAPPPPEPAMEGEAEAEAASDNGAGAPKLFAWKKRIGDSYQLATEALRAGRQQEAFEILFSDIERERTGRRRFLRKLQLLELCLTTGKEAIARPILDDVIALIEQHKIDDWEDRETVSQALITLMKASARLQYDEMARQNMFVRLCRLDPAAALDYQGEG